MNILEQSTRFFLCLMVASQAWGLPQFKGELSPGVTSSGGTTSLQITVGEREILNYQTFNIASGESVKFIQPSSRSVVLNRVHNGASRIDGSLNANGQLFLVNPQGVIFGNGSTVNVGSLAVSTLGISDSDFKSGNYRFSGSSGASIRNKGSLRSSQGGFIAMIGKQVINQGRLTSKGGKLALLSGKDVELEIGDGLISYTVRGNQNHALIKNTGTLRGEEVILQANAIPELMETVINNEGLIEASRIDTSGGIVRLLAPAGGKVSNTGDIKTGASGQIKIEGEFIDSEGSLEVGEETLIEEESVLQASDDTETTTSESTETAEEVINDTQDSVQSSQEVLIEEPIVMESPAIELKGDSIELSGLIQVHHDPEQSALIVIEAQDTLLLNPEQTISSVEGEIHLSSEGEIHLGGLLDTQTGSTKVSAASSITVDTETSVTGDLVLSAPDEITLEADLDVGGDLSVKDSTLYGENQTIRVGGDWDFTDNAHFDAGTSTVIFKDSSQDSRILGDNTFYNFTSTAAGKTLVFESGKTQTLKGDWITQGAYGDHVRLISSTPGEHWKVDPQGRRDLTYTWVEDSHNLHDDIIIMTESTNRGNSINWDPVGTWTNGNFTGIWSDSLNWTGLGGATPGGGDDVVFDGTDITDSLIDLAFAGSINSLSLNAGYTGVLSMGRSLTLATLTQSSGMAKQHFFCKFV
jgi:filamentous hemagglutinin family protein